MTTDRVLLVTASYDDAATEVSRSLERSGSPYFRLNTDQFPTQIKAVYDPQAGLTLETDTDRVNSSCVKSIWYRRNVTPALPTALDKYSREFCNRESKAFLEGALLSINARWLSDPTAIWRAEHKLFQLAAASDTGFKILPTSVTNDKDAARRFSVNRQTVVKTVSSGYIDSPYGYRAIFTNALPPEDLDELAGLDLAPVTFQENANKRSDIRVTVVGDSVFAAEIMSQAHPSSTTDWRATEDPNLPHQEHDLPDRERRLCLALVSRLGLEFGAIDLALTAHGKYLFFEINPNGEWLWLQYQLGFPIADRIAEWLVDEPAGSPT